MIVDIHWSIDELELSTRAKNCLNSAGIETIGHLVQKTEKDLLKIRGFGRTELRKIKRKLADIGLSIGMIVVEVREVVEPCQPRPEAKLDEVATAELVALANALGLTPNEEQTKTPKKSSLWRDSKGVLKWL